MNALLTDLYELTMAAGYVSAGRHTDRASFELFVRRLPGRRNFLIAAGLAQAVDYLLNLRFEADDIGYLRGLPAFAGAPDEFWKVLAEFRFTGDLWAVPEGTPVFPGEPILTVRAPLVEAQIPETYLLSTVSFQTMIASKAARVVQSAQRRSVIEFGTRRAHSPEAGVLAARAAFIGGCVGTSNALAGKRFGIPVMGTAAHSWIQAFDTEREAFARLQQMLGENTIYLVDTYDTMEGLRTAAELGRPLWGVRLDSGDLAELSRAARRILDDAGLTDARIIVSGDLNEYRILELTAAGAPIDSFGVGTELATSSDEPTLGAVYKLVEIESGGVKRHTAKFSTDKLTLPATKQVFRYSRHDVVAGSWECPSCLPEDGPSETLLRPVILGGELVEPLPSAIAIRDAARERIGRLPGYCLSLHDHEQQYPVEFSDELLTLYAELRSAHSNRGASA